MKRILALLLTVVLLALALTSCAYNYEKKSADLVSFDKAAFETALKNLAIEEDEFADASKRNTLVWDSVQKSLASAAGTSDKKTTGSPDANDVLYYCYYAQDGEGNQFFTSSNMKSGSEVNFQLGLSGLSELNVKIAEAITGFDFANVYKPTAEDALPTEGKLVSVSYTMQKGTEDAVSVTNAIVDLSNPGDGLTNLYTALAAEKVGTVVHDAEKTDTFTDGDVTFTNAKVDYVVIGTPLTLTYTDTENATERTAANGTKKSLKDVELTYYIYPVSYISVSSLDAASVSAELISSLSSDSLDVFKKDGAETELYTKAKAYADAKKAYDDAKKAYDDAKEEDKATAEQTMNEKNTAMGTALEELNTADKAAYDALDESAKTKAAERNVGESALAAAQFESVYQSLLSSLNNSTSNKVYAKIYAEMEKVTVNEVPEKAVKSIYNNLMDNYECTFYQGTSTKDTSVSNYKYYNDLAKNDDSSASAFELFLMAETASEDVAEAKDFIKEQAKSIVESTVRVYAIADAYGVKVTNKEFKQESSTYSSTYTINSSYNYVQLAFTEEATRTAIVFDRLMAVLAESETNDAGELTWKMVAFAEEN